MKSSFGLLRRVLRGFFLVTWPTILAETDWRCRPWDNRYTTKPQLFNDICFITTHYNNEFNFENAVSYYKSNGGILAKDNSPEQHKFLEEKLFLVNQRIYCYWIGLTDKGHRGEWLWLDGSKAQISKWASSLFSWMLDSVFDCTSLCSNRDERLEWIKDSCSNKQPVLCQYDAMKTPMDGGQKESAVVDPRYITETLVIQLTEWRGYRFTDKPDRVFRAYGSTSCARQCQKSETDCLFFQFHVKSRDCFGYRTLALSKEQTVEEDGWTLWTIVTKTVA